MQIDAFLTLVANGAGILYLSGHDGKRTPEMSTTASGPPKLVVKDKDRFTRAFLTEQAEGRGTPG